MYSDPLSKIKLRFKNWMHIKLVDEWFMRVTWLKVVSKEYEQRLTLAFSLEFKK